MHLWICNGGVSMDKFHLRRHDALILKISSDFCFEAKSLQVLLQVCSPSIASPLHFCAYNGGSFSSLALDLQLFWSPEALKILASKTKVLHTVGLAVLVFLAFPDLDSARVLMLTARFSSSSSWSTGKGYKDQGKQETVTISRHLQRWSNIIIIVEALQLCQPVFSCFPDFRRTTIGKGKHTNSWPWCKWSAQEWPFKITTAQIHFVQ